MSDALPTKGVDAVSRQGSPSRGSVPWALVCGAGLARLRMVAGG